MIEIKASDKTEKQIKSRDRVRDVAEVFTNKREVNNILDLIKTQALNPKATFFEPACGNGNFLVEILNRKLEGLLSSLKSKPNQEKLEFGIINSLSGIYAIDIMPDNIIEAKTRLYFIIKEFLSNNYNTKKFSDEFWLNIKWILDKNILLGNTLEEPNNIKFIEYKNPRANYFNLTEFYLLPKKELDLFNIKTELKKYSPVHYNSLHKI